MTAISIEKICPEFTTNKKLNIWGCSKKNDLYVESACLKTSPEFLNAYWVEFSKLITVKKRRFYLTTESHNPAFKQFTRADIHEMLFNLSRMSIDEFKFADGVLVKKEIKRISRNLSTFPEDKLKIRFYNLLNQVKNELWFNGSIFKPKNETWTTFKKHLFFKCCFYLYAMDPVDVCDEEMLIDEMKQNHEEQVNELDVFSVFDEIQCTLNKIPIRASTNLSVMLNDFMVEFVK